MRYSVVLGTLYGLNWNIMLPYLSTNLSVKRIRINWRGEQVVRGLANKVFEEELKKIDFFCMGK